MNCYFHPDRAAVKRCEKCGEPLCQECTVVVDGRSICKACVHVALDDRRSFDSRPRTKKVNFLLFTLFSFCLPGTNYMSLGLMKRGLFMMTTFFLSIYAIVLTGSPLFAFATAIIYIATFFDGYNLRSRMISGEYITDSVSDITGFLYKFRVPTIFFVGIVFISGFLSRGFHFLNRFFGYRFHDSEFSMLFFSIAVIAFGIYMVSRGKKNHGHDRVIDERNSDQF